MNLNSINSIPSAIAPTVHVEEVSQLLHSLRAVVRSADVLLYPATASALSLLKEALGDAIQDQTIDCFERAAFTGVELTLALFRREFGPYHHSKPASEKQSLIDRAVLLIDEAIAALSTLSAESLYGKGNFSTRRC